VSLSLLVMRVLADHARVSVARPVGVPLTLAFGAGVLSTLNPCGFALLPAFVSYTVELQVVAPSQQQPSGWRHLLRGGLLGLPLAGASCWSSLSQVARSHSAGGCFCICSPGGHRRFRDSEWRRRSWVRRGSEEMPHPRP